MSLLEVRHRDGYGPQWQWEATKLLLSQAINPLDVQFKEACRQTNWEGQMSALLKVQMHYIGLNRAEWKNRELNLKVKKQTPSKQMKRCKKWQLDQEQHNKQKIISLEKKYAFILGFDVI